MDMIGFLVMAFVLLLVAWPAVTLMHELGHAGMALACGARAVGIRIGRGDAVVPPPPQRFAISMQAVSGFYGWFRYEPSLPSRGKRCLILAAGPAASLLAGLALLGIGNGWSMPTSIADVLRFSGFGALLQFVMTAVPFTYPRSWGSYASTPSDGLRIVRELRSAS